MLSDSQVLNYLEKHPECVRFGQDARGKGVWQWTGNGKDYADAYTLRSAVTAAALYLDPIALTSLCTAMQDLGVAQKIAAQKMAAANFKAELTGRYVSLDFGDAVPCVCGHGDNYHECGAGPCCASVSENALGAIWNKRAENGYQYGKEADWICGCMQHQSTKMLGFDYVESRDLPTFPINIGPVQPRPTGAIIIPAVECSHTKYIFIMILTLLTLGHIDYLPQSRRPWVVDFKNPKRAQGRGFTLREAWKNHFNKENQ